MEHPHFVLTAVKNEQKLYQWLQKIENQGLECAIWHEPDKNNELTAIAIQPVFGEQRRFFNKLQLIKGEKNEDKTS